VGRFVKSLDEINRREASLFSSLDYGPIRGRNHDDGVTVETADGLKVELPVNSRLDARVDRDLLRAGVEVRTNGVVVGHLVQSEHGLRRSKRVLNLVGREPGRFPEGAHFRLRGTGFLSLEAGGRRLISHWPLIPRMRVQPDVTAELAAIYAAVSIGFQEPVRQATAWKR
jgi:hypothetical protein